MNIAKKKRYECIGGPLCGRKMCGGNVGLAYEDDDGRRHFYRLIRVAKNDFSATASFFHYFGTSFAVAESAHPRMLPPDRLFRKKKRR